MDDITKKLIDQVAELLRTSGQTDAAELVRTSFETQRNVHALIPVTDYAPSIPDVGRAVEALLAANLFWMKYEVIVNFSGRLVVSVYASGDLPSVIATVRAELAKCGLYVDKVWEADK